MEILGAGVLSLEDADRVLAERHLHEFIQQAWPIILPGKTFVDGWHIQAICEHMEAVAAGQIQNLVLNVPPRHMKSLIVSVFFPAWVWTTRPHIQFLTASYAADLAVRDAVRSRRVINSSWYQGLWGSRFRLTGDQNAKSFYENDQGGHRQANGVSGSTGKDGDILLADDPHNLAEIESQASRRAVLDWWDNTFYNRANDLEKSSRVIIMQRGHEDDLAGHVAAQAGWEVLKIPAEYEPTVFVSSIGWKDPREKPGEPLWPERFGADGEGYESLKVENRGPLSTRAFASQYQQNPVPAGGEIWQVGWWNFWQPRGASLPPVVIRLSDGGYIEKHAEPLPARYDRLIQSWDMTFKGIKAAMGDPDFVVGQVWGELFASKYLLDQERGQWDFLETIEAVRRLTERHPEAHAKYIEDKANGPAIISALKGQVLGLLAVDPAKDGDKVSRATSVTPLIEAGNVFLPHPLVAPWVWGFIEEAKLFPVGKNDDQVDAASQALRKLTAKEEGPSDGPKRQRAPAVFGSGWGGDH